MNLARFGPAYPSQPGPLTSLIARLPYFQAIIKETFLLHPATPLPLPRKADSDFEICQLYFVNAWAIGRDPNIWDNPSLFVPERFLGLDDQIDVAGKNFELIPFSAGRRICPGLPWTMPILPLMLGSLINSFEWKLEDGVLPETLNMEEKFGLTLQMAHPLRAVPKGSMLSEGLPRMTHIGPNNASQGALSVYGAYAYICPYLSHLITFLL
ncbi:cytochrome P450, family 76, subfamily C, polypeptide 4 [Prunus dulcis]|uniref:Cytochrome P450, family 76, subfamily C, polypeptide 4 n=1 Tax=Prunus dulcis TaxID=3755 RepID=A0A4Y1QX18_PRUDU|nr:cytochrome P450, family 76, subfamily C, polypeptide 4 [Prunus dulcis]